MITTPTVQPQPNLASYGLDSLFLFSRVTREIHLRETQKQADPFVPEDPPKYWRDDTALELVNHPSDLVPYSVFDERQGQIVQTFIPAVKAARFNLPGEYNYPKKEVEPTTAVIVGPMGQVSSMDPELLLTEEEAQALAKELGGVVEPMNQGTGYYSVNWGSEKRRRFFICLPNGIYSDAGGLLRSKRQWGIGAPGHWKNESGRMLWVMDPQVTENKLPEVPIPLRRLLPNEELRPFPMGVKVFRTDMAAPTPEADSSRLARIESKVDAILAKVSKP